jgi:hypothetical protein
MIKKLDDGLETNFKKPEQMGFLRYACLNHPLRLSPYRRMYATPILAAQLGHLGRLLLPFIIS